MTARLSLYAICALWLYPGFLGWVCAHEQDYDTPQKQICTPLSSLPQSTHTLQYHGERGIQIYYREKSSDSNLEIIEHLIQEQLDTFWSSIQSLPQLTSITINHSKEIEHLPENMTQMTSLQALEVCHTPLRALPHHFGQLTALKRLVISFTELRELPTSIGSLKNLQSLTLACNQMATLPHEFSQLTSLKSLVLANMYLTTLPTTFGQLSQLTRLNLWSNQLESLPDTIGDLKNLTWLDVSSNQLTQIPLTVEELTNLKTLNLSQNPIVHVPASIQNCKKLVDLRMLGCFQLRPYGRFAGLWGRSELVQYFGWHVMLDIFTVQSYDFP